MSDKVLLGYVSLLFACIAYFPYIWSILSKRTKPHGFSWIIWGILSAITYCAQYISGAGPGAWSAACGASGCAVVALLAIFWGEKNITRGDWLAFLSALAIIPVWYVTHEPLTAVILVVVIEAIGGYYPTFRKSYRKPHEEMLFMYLANTAQVLISLLALERYSPTTILEPLFVAIANSALALTIAWRRKG